MNKLKQCRYRKLKFGKAKLQSLRRKLNFLIKTGYPNVSTTYGKKRVNSFTALLNSLKIDPLKTAKAYNIIGCLYNQQK